MDHLTKKDGINGVNVTNNVRLALAYFTVIRQNTSSGLLQQGKYRGRQICGNMLNFLTAVISPCKSTQPQQAAKLLLKTTPGADCPLSSGQKKKEREFHKSLQRRGFRADEGTGFKKVPDKLSAYQQMFKSYSRYASCSLWKASAVIRFPLPSAGFTIQTQRAMKKEKKIVLQEKKMIQVRISGG